MLAIGARDELPAVEDLAKRWGRSIFHWPCCHGYELKPGPIGIIAASEIAHHHAMMLPDWGAPTLFLNGAYRPTDDDIVAFARRGTTVEATSIVRVEGVADVVLTDDRTLSMNGLFTQPRTHIASPIAAQLGCTLVQGPMGVFIQLGAMQQTYVPNVFACGDAARAAGSVAMTVADAAMAWVAAHRSTMF
ncbi:thioredoxin reductase [Variovorax ginsengisoli]|uniref:Thioredoxin reductase n=1 Tax=Variovorax ginsengisoli TaxID=363844 RepID=A0ABT9S5S3_9BURK|nr:thioredoxin reductase [Variovorax ginsengisoli]